jgi:hypothetical protein
MEGGSARKEKAESTRGESGAETGNGQAGRHTHRRRQTETEIAQTETEIARTETEIAQTC